MKKKYLFAWVYILMIPMTFAQNPIPVKKHVYVDSTGKYYQQASLPVYIYVSSSPQDAPVGLTPSSGNTSEKAITLDGHGVHNLSHYDSQAKKESSFQIFADGLAPFSNIRFLNAPHYQNNTTHYYGKNLAVELSSKDEMSGIQATFHSINGSDFASYTTFVPDTEGKYTYKYYAVDNVGNTESIRTQSFVIDWTAPNTYHNIIGISSDSVISTNTTIYLTPTDNLSGISKTFYHFDQEPFKPYVNGNINFQYLTDGEHTLTYYSIDNVSNKETTQTVSFFFDKTAPITSADVLGDRFLAGNKVYFSGRTKLKLLAVDNKSGVKDLLYSIDGEPFHTYTDPFYLPNKSGIHDVSYYAIDNTQNMTDTEAYMHNAGIIYVDLTGPALNYDFGGMTFQKGDTTYISPTTQINLKANDPESGLQYIAYAIDQQADETPYKKSFTIPSGGVHKVHYFGYDNVNNRNIATFVVQVDNTPPNIFYNFSTAAIETDTKTNLKTYPSYLALFISSSDQETGINTISYSINNGPMVPYGAPIRGFKKRKEYTIKVTTTDLLGNSKTEEIHFKTGKY